MVMRESNDERKKIVRQFYEKVAVGLPVEPQWLDGMIDASAPAIDGTPSAEQLEAWAELRAIMDDPSFVACKRASAADAWAPPFRVDPHAFVDAQHAAMLDASDARARGLAPSSGEAAAIVDRFARRLAAAAELADTRDIRAHLRIKYDPRGPRYWELVGILRGDSAPVRYDDWRWLGEAFAAHPAGA